MLKQTMNLKANNTLRLPALVDNFYAVSSVIQLKEALQQTTDPIILGEGSNVVLAKASYADVIALQLKGIELVDEDDEAFYVKAAAGENWHQFVLYCIEHDYFGIENLSLIPGTVGAAPVQNIGAYGVELKDVFYELEALDRNSLEMKIFDKNSCQFSYRNSLFKSTARDEYIITAVTLRLAKQPNFVLGYPTLQEKLKDYDGAISAKAISDAVCAVRRSRLPDPAEIGNVGSFFMNPVVDKAALDGLLAKHPELVYFDMGDRQYRVPAAQLIKLCGFTDINHDGIGVYEKNAIVLVNQGEGTGEAVLHFTKKIQSAVKDRFDIDIHPEPRIY
tara:strand:+ start:120441 stop:121439 length:999 start_codon:yes stop_codon:yes gene_type:complete